MNLLTIGLGDRNRPNGPSGRQAQHAKSRLLSLHGSPEKRLAETNDVSEMDSAAGEAEDEIYWNVSVRVIPAETLLEDPSHCRVTLMTWRTSADPDEFWFDMYHAYLCYMERLKIILERRFAQGE